VADALHRSSSGGQPARRQLACGTQITGPDERSRSGLLRDQRFGPQPGCGELGAHRAKVRGGRRRRRVVHIQRDQLGP
jgi:hypothetical protein